MLYVQFFILQVKKILSELNKFTADFQGCR